jgi:dTDP-4-dehydrorhamnose 3,5-epimerase-like enzyme
MNPSFTKVSSRVRGVAFYEMRTILDPTRGNLTVGEFGGELPFVPQRYFITYHVPAQTIRGEHAHKACAQFLLSVSGQCCVRVDDGSTVDEFVLDRPTVGVYIPPMVWATEYKHSLDSRLMVFASLPYDADDYIRDYAEFRRLAGG